MASVDLVGIESESFANDASLEVGREKAIATTDEGTRRHVGPTIEWPHVVEGSPGLFADMLRGLCGDVGRHVVEEQLNRVVHVDPERIVAGV
jgi:hypothetical protein